MYVLKNESIIVTDGRCELTQWSNNKEFSNYVDRLGTLVELIFVVIF